MTDKQKKYYGYETQTHREQKTNMVLVYPLILIWCTQFYYFVVYESCIRNVKTYLGFSSMKC